VFQLHEKTPVLELQIIIEVRTPIHHPRRDAYRLQAVHEFRHCLGLGPGLDVLIQKRRVP